MPIKPATSATNLAWSPSGTISPNTVWVASGGIRASTPRTVANTSVVATSRWAPRSANPNIDRKPMPRSGSGRIIAMATGRSRSASAAVTGVDHPLTGSIIW